MLEFKNFSFKYNAQKEASLKDISFSLKAGEKIAIVGPSGCGKSTLLQIINGIIPHHFSGQMSGYARLASTVLCDGFRDNCDGLPTIGQTSKLVGTVLQDPDGQFIGLTVAEDLAFLLENEGCPREEMLEKVSHMAEILGMHEHLSLPPQLLSGGQKQRVSLGGVLIGGTTELLLCDEPLAALDPAAGMETIELLHKMRSDHSCIIVEHRLEDVLYKPIDRIILMHQGRIVADMPPSDLLASDLLERHGVRSPLYISALRYAGLDLSELASCSDISRLDELKLNEGEQAHIKRFVESWNASGDKTGAIVKQEQVQAQEGDQVDAQASAQVSMQASAQDLPLLELKDLCFAYEPDPTQDASERKEVLSDLNLKLYPGDMISICGCNGAGKSSLAKLLCAFEQSSSGDILLNGKSLLNQTIAQRAQDIAYVLQDPNHMISQPTVLEELSLVFKQGEMANALSKSEQEQRIVEVLKVCGLYPYRNWPISVLSYGQKKRVTIASVLVMRPKVLILDEPTAGQDWAHYTEIMDFLLELNKQGLLIVLITHDMHLALEYTNKTAVLSQGKIIAYEPCSAVLTNPELCKEAHLKMTSLYHLAQISHIKKAQDLVEAFIACDKSMRPENLLARISEQEGRV